MENTNLSIGNTTTLELDFEAGSTEVYLLKPSQPHLMDLYEEQLGSLKGVTVCLSGGIDSQFTANLAKKFCKDVNAVCFRFMWGDVVINTDDVVTAKQFADKIDLELHFEDVDVKNHLDNNLVEYTRRYATLSPQISLQLAAIKNSKFNDRTLMLGGEAPTCVVSPDFNSVFLQRKNYFDEDGNINNSTLSAGNFYFIYNAPFINLEHEHGLHIIKDPFLLTPEILYAGYYQNKYVIESFGQVLTSRTDQKKNAEIYKQNYYKSFEEFEYVFPLAKRTGFENLKFHLASMTGNFDEFDERYRVPLLNVAKETAWYNPRLFDAGSRSAFSKKINPVNFNGIHETELEDIILNSIRETEPTSCNVYNFDW
tara:strand:+ start:65 stop:1168 length:1104 start_codon:yes stop_codon:yes gene_type:complete